MDQVAAGTGTVVTTANHAIVLFNADGLVWAIEAWCLRCGRSLGGGILQGKILSCRGCDWRYDITTGGVVGIPALRLDTFKVQVVAGRIMVATT